jgi:hypothetical protein
MVKNLYQDHRNTGKLDPSVLKQNRCFKRAKLRNKFDQDTIDRAQQFQETKRFNHLHPKSWRRV